MLKSTEKGTFLVRVLDQQHSSWQGTITWLASGKVKTFRSVLEMITIIGGELESCQTDEKKTYEIAAEEKMRDLDQLQFCSKSIKSSPSMPDTRQRALETLEPAV